jgi:hypothetical protein
MSKVPSFSFLWQQNKAVFKKHLPDLTLFCGIAFVTWLIEVVCRQYLGLSPVISLIPFLRGLPFHYLPEWGAFFYMGRFACDLKAGPIPTRLSVSTTYLLSTLVVFALFGFSWSWFLFSVLFTSPFLFGYLVQKASNHFERSKG